MLKCTRCGSFKLQKRGSRNGRQRYQCQGCRYWFSEYTAQINEEIKKDEKRPIIAVMDIETLPAISYHWNMFDISIGNGQTIVDKCFLSWAAKILNSTEVYSDILTSSEAINRDPERITLSAWKFLNKVDIVIGHNWNNFDGKMLNTFFLMYATPVYYRSIDTYTIAKSNFKFSKNSLEYINDTLGIRNKMDTGGFLLWRGCDQGDQESLDKMLEYNIVDILATEELYYKFRPFIKSHPGMAFYDFLDSMKCPNCGCEDLNDESKQIFTRGGRYDSYRCSNCGAIHRGRKNLLTKEEKVNLVY